jgi:hypothetical protein
MTKGRPTANSPTQEVTKLKLNLNIERKISAIEEGHWPVKERGLKSLAESRVHEWKQGEESNP